jgi:hypothetical protein
MSASDPKPGPEPSVYRIGENVPWVSPWSTEGGFTLALSERFPNHLEVIQSSAPGVGTPSLRGMHLLRQRLGVAEHLCHVCGKPTTPGDRYLFPVVTGNFLPPSADGQRRYASPMPPAHLACAQRAQKLCPHLKLSYAQPVRFPSDPGKLKFELRPPRGMEAVGAGMPVDQAIFSYYRVHTPGFSRLVERLRAQAAAEGRTVAPH